MLHPRILVTLGAVIVLAGLVAGALTSLGAEALVVGVPVGAAIVVGALLGGGPKPVPPGGYRFEDAMGMLRRVTRATALVAAAFVGSASGLWALGSAPAIDVLLIAVVALLTVYGAMLTAIGIVVVAHVARREADAL